MATLVELLADNTGLSGPAVDHLQLLVADWQLLADLAFSDLLLIGTHSSRSEKARSGNFLPIWPSPICCCGCR